MRRLLEKVVVQLDNELAGWLEAKEMEGYNKASFVRAVLHREMENEEEALGPDESVVEDEELAGNWRRLPPLKFA